MQIEDKVLQFASFISNMRKDLRLGGLVGIYLIIKNDQVSIGDEIKKVVMEEIFLAIQDFES
jgi:hypothetical protein